MVTAGRPKTRSGCRVIFGIKLSEEDAARCDAARGEVPRSEWGRELLLAALEPRPLPSRQPGRAIPAPAAESSRKPRAARSGACPHRLPENAYCKKCVAANGG